MTRKNWTLLVIAAARGEPMSPVQLQKSLFLLGRNLTPAQLQADRFYTFRNYDYGPFNQAIYEHAEQLEAERLVSGEVKRNYRRYAATMNGVHEAERLRAGLDPAVNGYVDRVVGWVRSLPFDQLVREIYRLYPETKVNSVFRG